MTRYDQLLKLIDLFQPKSIVEVGVWNGHNAIRMIRQAQKYHKDIVYTGYDLFEEATPETDVTELNVKPHHTVQDVGNLIVQNTGIAIDLVRGNTRQTLTPHTKADFVFIDGGHSVETIESDYMKLRQSRVVVLDDYYTPDETGACPDINIYGCNKLVNLYVRNSIVLPHKDYVSGGGHNQLVLVV